MSLFLTLFLTLHKGWSSLPADAWYLAGWYFRPSEYQGKEASASREGM